MINEILLIYCHPVTSNAPTIMEHVNSFEQYSKYPIRKINTEFGFPAGLETLEFSVILIHYSSYRWLPILDKATYHSLPRRFWNYVRDCKSSLKVAFFQDEMHNCEKRFHLINSLKIDIVYSLLSSRYFEAVYYQNTSVKKVVSTLTGYVSENLISSSRLYFKPFNKRKFDVGYRARPLPFYMGRGGQEKTDIAYGFLRHTEGLGLSTNVKVNEADRIYGNKWFKFVSNCKFMLGVESGTSIFDLNGNIEKAVTNFLSSNPTATFFEVSSSVLEQFEENINYRTISPRVFECAAFRVCMILFRGAYQGILQPNVHYISLEKDFSNINEVLHRMADSNFVEQIVENSYRDLIQSGRYHYSHFIDGFDSLINNMSINFEHNQAVENMVNRIFNKGLFRRKFITYTRYFALLMPGRSILMRIAYLLGYKGNS